MLNNELQYSVCKYLAGNVILFKDYVGTGIIFIKFERFIASLLARRFFILLCRKHLQNCDFVD